MGGDARADAPAAVDALAKVQRPTFPDVMPMSKQPRLAGKVCGARVVVFSRGGCDDTKRLVGTIPDLPGQADDCVETATPADWDRTLGINVKGHAIVTKACIPGMKAAGGGSIVFQDNSGSISSFLAQPGCATYSTIKAAIVQLARSCAYDLAKYDAWISPQVSPPHIRVNSICAGTIETPISADERAAHGWTYDEWESLKVKDVMMRRVGHAGGKG
eukprot:gene55717-18040_t